MKLFLLILFIYCTSIFSFEQSFVFHGQKKTPAWSIPLPENQTLPLTLKIKAVRTPDKGTIDSSGITCNFVPVGHEKILVELGIKDINTGLYYDRIIVDNIEINEESIEKTLKIIPNKRNMSLDIIGISWDYTCKYHLENTQGFDKFHHSYSQYCPWDQVWPDDCIAFTLKYH
jgi:hypothetical protein